MILALWIGILMGAGILAWIAGSRFPNAARWICVLALGFDLCLVADYWISGPGSAVPGGDGWMTRYQVPWIPSFGIDFHLGLDGFSLLMVALLLLGTIVYFAVDGFSNLLGVAADDPIAWIIPAAFPAVGVLGVLYALVLKSARPEVYQAIGLGANSSTGLTTQSKVMESTNA